MREWKTAAAGLYVVVMMAAAPAASAEEPANDPFDVFAAHDETNRQTINYEEFDRFLGVYAVNSGSRVNFYFSAMSPQGVDYLEAYSNALARLDPSRLSRQEQLAYWLNLRNALVLYGIAVNNPGRSLKDERWQGGEPGIPGEMWTRKRVTVEGVPLSIDDIEQHILLKHFDDPNVLYGMYQGMEGGPPMFGRSFTGPEVENQLSLIGQAYVNSRRHVRARSNRADVSLIYHWYKDPVFDGSDAKVIEHIASLAQPGLRDDLAGLTTLGDRRFRYSLDEQEVRQQRRSIPSGGGGFGRGS